MASTVEQQSLNGRDGTNGDRKKKSLILNAFVEMCSGHQSPGLWQHPDDQSTQFNDVDHWVALAKLLESAKFHGIFIADVLGGYDVYNGPRNLDAAIRSGAQWPVNEPLAVVSAMAAATKSLGFGVTVATTYEQPYHLARRLSTVDHLTKGRLGWNIVTGYLDSAARNLGSTEQPQHDERYAMAEEYLKVMYKLWESSWRDDAVVLDRKKGIYTYPDRVREFNHKGKYYTVPGPHLCQPSPQRTPVLLQAGTSKAGKNFAAQHAEAIFVAGHSPSVVAKNVAEVRELARTQFGRDPENIKFLALICPIVGRTKEEATAKFNDYAQYGSIEGALALFGGWTGIDLATYDDDQELREVESNAIRSAVEAWSKSAPGVKKWTKHTVARHITVGGLGATVAGTASEVADEFERWVAEADVDGFNIAYAIKPGTFVDVIELLLPELRKRNLFWNDYAVQGGTYRENIYMSPGQKGPLAEHVASKYRWRAGVDAKDHQIPS
ncbi:putative xenobiotic compound monooxygenase, DszA family [Lepidopterella palustris CBS 459.81]|uniref:Putative xenobiotic compound monooxygenase, DszA family n=1 Tax=Lepidopterella palustris CBS 459.81 TaxID=1314670 RepID=A0A8E2EA17_9PEZI|nr:putative xenobiotic compound monooxygenase, DszA family [Lepidopterella palustris CBS 459.81]